MQFQLWLFAEHKLGLSLLKPFGKLLVGYVFPQTFSLSSCDGFELFVPVVQAVPEPKVGVCKALGEQRLIEEFSVGQPDVGEQAPVVSPCAVVLIKINRYLFSYAGFGRELGRLFTEVHRGDFRTFRFGRIDTPKADSRVIVLAVGDIDIDSVTIYDIYDCKGLSVVFFKVALVLLLGTCGLALPLGTDFSAVEPYQNRRKR